MTPATAIYAEGARLCGRCVRLLALASASPRSEGERGRVVLVAGARVDTLAALTRLRRESPEARLVGVFCGTAGATMPEIEYFSRGLDDFVSCPWTADDLQLRLGRLPCAGAIPEAGWPDRTSLIGRNPGFLRLLEQVTRAARTQATVLLTGETGTGKELVARAVHYLGDRTHRAFVPLNCGAVPDHLFENELFGHAKGAFTDASAAERGLLGEAEGGTVFFDEIDALSPAAQVKILRLLQDREYRPLGAARTLVADVRIVAATNADLAALVQARTFREDLYHRLRLITLDVPPLRDRADDIPLLARHFIRKHQHESGYEDCGLDPSALERLVAYRWPGNVRELESVIHRALVLSGSRVLRAQDLDVPGASASADRPEDSRRDEPFRTARERAIQDFEARYLTALLTRHHGNVTHAARAAGTDRRALQRLLDKHRVNRVAYSRTA